MSGNSRLAALALAGAALLSAPVQAQGVAGTWNLVASTQMGEFRSVMTVAEANGSYTVEIADVPPEGAGAGGGGGDFGPMESKISNVSVNGSELSFTRSLSGAFSMVLNYKLTVEGDSLKGEAGSDFGPTPITGTRAN